MIMHSLIFPFMLLLSAIFSFEKWSFFYRSPIRSGMTRMTRKGMMRKEVRKRVGDDGKKVGYGERKLKFNLHIK